MIEQQAVEVRDFLAECCTVESMEGEPHPLGSSPWMVIEGDGSVLRFCGQECLTWHYSGGSG